MITLGEKFKVIRLLLEISMITYFRNGHNSFIDNVFVYHNALSFVTVNGDFVIISSKLYFPYQING